MSIYKINYTDAASALSVVQSGNRVFVHGSAHTPTFLLKELSQQADRLRNVEIVSITVYGDVYVNKKELADSFHINSLFVSASVRECVNEGYGDFIPVFLSDIPILFRNNVLPLDVAIVQVSVPDEHGYCSLGISTDIARTAVDCAKYVIAQVNPNAPRTFGDSAIHISKITSMVYCEEPLHEITFSGEGGSSEIENKIGKHVAELIDDRSTIQMGIGAIPDAVLKCLHNHKDLGMHTEMFSDGVIPLLEKEVITNKYKKILPNKSLSSFALGSKKLYSFINNNPSFTFQSIDFVNSTVVILQNPKMIAINSAIEIDLTGQVCADSIGTYQYSGIGGQMDFMRGAALSQGGKPIIALPSRTAKGIPRIVPFLRQGAGVVTTRGHVQYVVTEYGVAMLRGLNLRQRAKALINIAHPDDRETLEKACRERFKMF
ncbi:MAG: 4-hydroxybutyrate CoA-transferase [Chitinophagaceae bacterium]|jgi:acyl-CoA hydrolase|nr:4-hydroxybutyrate CoA-transferase [Chitinophagaceae bacterium]